MTPAAEEAQWVTFRLGQEEYAVPVADVQEILRVPAITPVPASPAFVEGVINLRGKVIPITDLRCKFGMSAEDTEDTCIIVVQMQGIQTGIVVDRVSEVVAIGDSDIEDAPTFGAGVHTEFLLGIGKAGGRVKLLLDIDKVLATAEMAALEAARGAAD